MEKTYIYSPILFIDKALSEFLPQINESGCIESFDTLRSQLREYIKTSDPKTKFDDETIENSIDQWFEKKGSNYGTWVYYPWLNTDH
ncbi:MAG: hypothetical protein HYZ42_13710 [Bacteroidetes bacterium]|nr:hypothetical protein [Bacteroidota bacterium]